MAFTVLWSVTLKIGAFTKLGSFFPVVCFIHVFDQTLAEQLYLDKDLLYGILTSTKTKQKYNTWFINFKGWQGAKASFNVSFA